MKRSEAIKKLLHKVISPTEIIRKEYFDAGIYEKRAESLLKFIEEELGMRPPVYSGVIASGKKYNHAEDFARDTALFEDWEPEDETK